MSLLDGAKIRYLREQRGWDQKQLAAIAHLTPSVISRLERGIQSDFKLSVAIAVAQALGVQLDSVLNEKYRSKLSPLTQEAEMVLAVLAKQPPAIQLNVVALIQFYLSIHGK